MLETLDRPDGATQESEYITDMREKIGKASSEVIDLQTKLTELETELENTPEANKTKVRDEIIKVKVIRGRKVKELEALEKESGLPEYTESIEENEFWGETAPKDMLYEEALAWVAELSARDGVEYKIPAIEELEQAHKDQIKGFNMEKVYLSSTEDDFLKGNHFGFNFQKGIKESKARGSYFAIRVTK